MRLMAIGLLDRAYWIWIVPIESRLLDLGRAYWISQPASQASASQPASQPASQSASLCVVGVSIFACMACRGRQ